jgi:hypothetical protein
MAGETRERASDFLEEVGSDSGVDAVYRNGEEAGEFTILESLGGGVGLIDYDGDGLLDIVVPGGGSLEGKRIIGLPTKFYRNLGDFHFADVTSQVGLQHEPFYTHGCAVGDYDQDGWPDLLITGYGRVALFHNIPGNDDSRRFEETTSAAGIDDTRWSTSAGWGDVDGDGDPDIYLCHYVDWSWENHPFCPRPDHPELRQVCSPEKFKPLPDALYLNQGDGTFVRGELPPHDPGNGLGVLLADLDDDRRPDIYVANDGSPNLLFVHRNGTLEEVAGAVGVAWDDQGQVDGSMGVDVTDWDGTGRPAVMVTNFQGELHALYSRRDSGQFNHDSRLAGLGAFGRKFVSFGVGFLDLDLDGWEDLVVTSGHVFQHPVESTHEQVPLLLKNEPGGAKRRFQRLSDEAGYFSQPRVGRGLAIGDLNNDGRPDVVVSHTNERVALLKNVKEPQVDAGWVGMELEGRDHRDLAGTRVTVNLGSRQLTRYFKGGGSYLSSGDRRLLFGLGDRAQGPVKATIYWSWGEQQTVDLSPGRYHRILEPADK